MKPLTIERLYDKLKPDGAAGTAPAGPGTTPREIGHFNVFDIAQVMRGYASRPPITFDRRAYYKISLLRGRSRVEYGDQTVEIERGALWVATPRVPYRWTPHDLTQTGYFCVFTPEFLRPAKCGLVLDELPTFRPGPCPVWELTETDYAYVDGIFQKMLRQITTRHPYKYDLLHTYLLELIYGTQPLAGGSAPAPTHSAAARLTAQFTDLLERQFPLASPRQQLRLRTAGAYADALATHVNHLNRVLKETTGYTTTELLAQRLAHEAKVLLKQTNWTVAEIADSLGFADGAHFSHFFKRQTSLTPGDFRG